MACLGLRATAGGMAAQDHGFKNRAGPPNRVTLPLSRPAKTGPVQCSLSIEKTGSRTGAGTGIGGREKFDRWMSESVVEIVKNLREAPLFVHVYGDDGAETRLKTERAIAEDWGHMKGKWEKGEERSPEGIILVEELKGEDDVEIYDENKENVEGQSGENCWGVLIQGKGDDGGAACYLLKTSKVGCSNLGLFCTHYCLVRVKSFRETAKSQLTSCWLV